MAEGSSSLKHVRLVTDTTLALKPRSIVDLGMGTGKYGYVLREQHDLARVHWGENQWRLRLVGVEAYKPYITPIARAVYDEIVVSDAAEYLHRPGEEFDVALALDVLEHFEPDAGEEFIAAALRRARHVMIVTPRGYYRQEGHINTFERHLSWWPAKALEAVARRRDANVATARSLGATIAVFSRRTEPRAAIVADRPLYETAIQVRDRLVPDVLWCKLRHKAGPVVAS